MECVADSAPRNGRSPSDCTQTAHAPPFGFAPPPPPYEGGGFGARGAAPPAATGAPPGPVDPNRLFEMMEANGLV